MEDLVATAGGVLAFVADFNCSFHWLFTSRRYRFHYDWLNDVLCCRAVFLENARGAIGETDEKC